MHEHYNVRVFVSDSQSYLLHHEFLCTEFHYRVVIFFLTVRLYFNGWGEIVEISLVFFFTDVTHYYVKLDRANLSNP